MCLIAWNWQPDSETPLLLLANRDEFYARPALPLHWWSDGQLLAGQDMQAGGTWLGVNRRGCLAAITNFRMPSVEPVPKLSRGALVVDFLQSNRAGYDYLAALAEHADSYNPFNLLVFDGRRLMGLESRNRNVISITEGIGGVSNADFDTPWPKMESLKQGLHKQCLAGRTEVPHLLPLLQDRSAAGEAQLPQTGIRLSLERDLSATFVTSAHYGTRACSIVSMNRKKISFFEESHDERGMLASAQQFFTYKYSVRA